MKTKPLLSIKDNAPHQTPHIVHIQSRLSQIRLRFCFDIRRHEAANQKNVSI
jgi:hypothetical protein